MLYLTLKEWLFLRSFNAIICEKKIILPSGKEKADPLTECSVKKSRFFWMKLEKGNSWVYSH